MKSLKFLLVTQIIFLGITVNAQQTHIRLDCGHERGMAYVQGYEYDGGCEFVFKDSCRIEQGRGELNFTMDDDSDVTVLLITEKQKTMHRLTVGPGDSVALSYNDRHMTIVEDKRRFREEYARFSIIGNLHDQLRERLNNESFGSQRRREIEDSIRLVEHYYYNEFPYDILSDTALTQSVYIVHKAIAIISLAGATHTEVDSLRTTFAERLPHPNSLTVRGDKHTERSVRDRNRFNELLKQMAE